MKPVAFLITQKGRPQHPLDAVLPHRAQSLRGDRYEAVPLYTEEPRPTPSPFLHGAMVQTMFRDFNRLRAAIRSHDSFATEAAWEKCERWVAQLDVKSAPDTAHIKDQQGQNT